MRRLELVEGSSSKFWEIQVEGSSYTVRFGRIGTVGQTKNKAFETASEAQQAADKLLSDKLDKGYRDAKPTTASSTTQVANATILAADTKPPAPIKMTLASTRGKPAIAIAILGLEVDIDGVVETFATPALAKQHVDKVVRVRLAQGYTLGAVTVSEAPEKKVREPKHVERGFGDVADVERNEDGWLRISFEPECKLTKKACTAIVGEIAAQAPRTVHVQGDVELPGTAWAKGLTGKVLPSVRDFIFDIEFLSPGQQNSFSLGDLQATFDAMPALERCFLVGDLAIQADGTHAALRQLHLVGAPLKPEFLLGIASWKLPALELLALSLASDGEGADDAALAICASKRPALRALHLNGLTNVGAALDALLGAKGLHACVELRVEGRVDDDDDLFAVLERHSRRVGELKTLGLPLRGRTQAPRLKALGPMVRDLSELPALTTYHAWKNT
ncbi:MAG TPA: WGR domain-containing protein [Kofleriaceae bacterium]|nr:WGR domain-containing protein [Kofleriaceae bacterium]